MTQRTISRHGHGVAAGPEEADASVLVTCTVIDYTERKMLKRIRALASRGKPPVVAGCMAAAQRDLARRVRPDIVHVTRFSVRAGTPAASMTGQVVGWRAKERSRRLSRLRFRIAREINEGCFGRSVPVLTTEPGKGGTTLSRTDTYKQVVLPSPEAIGVFREARITQGREADLIGELI